MTTMDPVTAFESSSRELMPIRTGVHIARQSGFSRRMASELVVTSRPSLTSAASEPKTRNVDEAFDELVVGLAFLEAAPDAIVVTGPDGTIGRANRRAERLFGYDRSELIGRSIETIVPDESRAARTEDRPRKMGEVTALDGLRKNGTRVSIEVGTSTVESTMGPITIAIIRDVTLRRELEEELRFASTHDSLTGLYNRVHLDAARRELDATTVPIGVIIIDVDGLKTINDRMGHEAGDRLLKRCAIVLRSISSPSVIVGRLGGDEFAVILPRATAQVLERTVSSIRSDLERHNDVTSGPRLELSIGAALSVSRGGMTQAMRVADRRMYEEKRSRKLAR